MLKSMTSVKMDPNAPNLRRPYFDKNTPETYEINERYVRGGKAVNQYIDETAPMILQGIVGGVGRAIIARRGMRAAEFERGTISQTGFLKAAEEYLGPSYKTIENGRYISADGLRQVRFGYHEVKKVLHGHFEAYDNGIIIENGMVRIIK